MNASHLISAAAAAKRLGVSTRTLRRYTADGTLPDLRRALGACQADGVTALLVSHPERLVRFGTGLLADVVLPSWGVALEVVGGDDLDGGDGDLVRDMLAVVTSFAGGLYGSRSPRARALTTTVKDLTRDP